MKEASGKACRSHDEAFFGESRDAWIGWDRGAVCLPAWANIGIARESAGADPLLANFNNTLQRTSEVGLYPPNPLGVYDLHGNVWEWTSSTQGLLRVIRGGSWHSSAERCAAAFRNRLDPTDCGSHFGFRLLAVPSV